MGEISYRPLIEAMTWSYSRLEIFDDCPYRWFLIYIHTPKLKKEDKFYAAYGLFMHDLLEKYFKGENSKEEILMMFLIQFKERTKGTGRPKAATVKKYFQSGAEFIKSLEPLRFKMISVEEKIDFKIGDFDFTGRIDYLGEEDGEFVIVDNKSRDLKPRSGREKPTLKDKELDLMLRQLYIYAEAVRQKYSKLPKLLCFNCFKTGVFIEEPFNEDAYREALSWAQHKVEEISGADEFYPNREFFSCYYLCSLSNHCCYDIEAREIGRAHV